MNKIIYLLSLSSLLDVGAQASTPLHFGDLENSPEISIPSELQEFENFEMSYSEVFNKTKGFKKTPRAYDPVNKSSYEKVVVGTTFKASWISSYTHWRYVTVYDVKTEGERLAYLPYFEEDCHDNSQFMAQWGETRSFKVTLKTEVGASIAVGDIGLSSSVSMSIEEGVSFSTSRRVRAVEGIQARHYPYKQSDSWTGVTYIQTYNANKGTYGYLAKSYYEDWFGGYPYAFELDNQNVGFKVKRKILKTCENYNPAKDPILDSEMYDITKLTSE
jgi:hypothetical protein